MGLIYYLPEEISKSNLTQDYCDIFKILGRNALIIDRTETIPSPVKITNLFPIPSYSLLDSFNFSFSELCIKRATELLSSNKPIVLFYSGGIDSTVVLLAFDFLLRGKNKDQITIATTPFAIKENPRAWNDVILPNYKIVSTLDAMKNIDIHGSIYVQGENADQLYGSDKIFSDGLNINKKFSKDELYSFLSSKLPNPDNFVNLFFELSEKAPFQLKLFREFLWWINFTCKWQGVVFRTLATSGALRPGVNYSKDILYSFDPFFNTTDFQLLSLSNKLKRFGAEPSSKNYKLDSRLFIDSLVSWPDYTKNKIKFGSMWNVNILTNSSLDAIRLAGGSITTSLITNDDYYPRDHHS